MKDITEFVLNEEYFVEAPNRTADMIGRPTKAVNPNKMSTHATAGAVNGRVPKDEAWLLIKLYEATVDPGNKLDVVEDQIDAESGEVYGLGGISRKNLLKLCGNANWDTPGEASTFFSGLFKDLDLARIKNDIIYPGPNLEKWLDETQIFTIPNRSRYGSQQGREYAHEPNMRRFLGTADLGRKSACSGTERNRPNPLADLKGITFVPADDSKAKKPDTFKKEAEPVFKQETPVEQPAAEQEVEWDPSAEIDWGGDNAVDWGDIDWTTANDENGKKAVGESFKMTDRLAERNNDIANKVKSCYRKKCNLDEEAEINEDNFDCFALKVECMKNHWGYDEAKEKLFSKGN